ncbi:Protein SIEVE ELEMENT OCCLUSION B [Camellia lanceoleosa]|uniref:Protein SIEVE ELEMENT OCCLUSION B n=1 Tax=Camellia lanceoleosa TaxID=1840588 RepID=A0ACC0G6P8_9ERIC|nr:Protein SIEVE ELEMENT OCCLUSION B [Camellia lanceoleosa]
MATAIVPPGGRVQGARLDRRNDAMMKQIQATHAPDGCEVDVKALIHVIEDIMHCSTLPIPGLGLPPVSTSQVQLDASEDLTVQNDFTNMLELLAYPIDRISCEIAWNCLGGSDAHTTTLAVFNTLSSYSWEAKVVITFAAFAVNYGEFWLVAQLYPSNPLAKSVALLKQLPDMLEHADSLKPKFEALINLIKAMLDVTKCIMVTAKSHTAIYWTIRSIVACVSQIKNFIGMGHKYIASTTEAWELSSLPHMVNNIYSHLQKQLALCYQHIDEKRYIEAFQMLVSVIETAHIDNKKTVKSLIYAKDDQLTLVDGSNKKRVSIDVLSRKYVLLIISDLDVFHEEHFILDQMYTESRQNRTRPESQYEVVWFPVLDRTIPWNDAKQQKFKAIQASMPWFSLYHPLVDPAVIKYIKEYWHFKKKPLLVVLDQHGKLVNRNAIHMMWIWESMAFPFTSLKEEALWKETTWSIELLADSIDQSIVNWTVDRKYICLYGGEDLEWIRKFTNTAKDVAKAAGITLEMLYVGKSNPREKVRKISNTILGEKLSHILSDPTLIWFFWVRLESMWHSKMQHGKSVENDLIMQEIMTIMSFDGSEQGWAVISHGTAEIAKAKGDNMLTSLTKYEDWKDHANEVGFVNALIENLEGLRTPHHCNRLILPGTTGSIPEKVVCAECGRPMDKFIMYRCCTD